MLEVYVLVKKKKSMFMKVLAVVLGLLGIYFVYAALLGVFICLAIAIPFFAIAWYLYKKETEFEYSYFDGDFRFAKIYNKQKRKNLRGYEAENVIMIAKCGDRSIYPYENNPQIKKRDLTSGYKDRDVYYLVAKTETGYELTKFEPDEKYLDAVCVKYRQKVMR